MKTKHKSGLTLVEMLLSLAILGMLMATVAIAFDASVKNHQDNQGIYRTVNTARQTLLRLTNDIRTANWVGLIGVDDPDNKQLTLEIIDKDGTLKLITYYFSPVNDSENGLEKNTLYLFGEGGSKYKLCQNITSISFDRDVHDGTDKVRNVRIVLTVTDPDSGISQNLEAAAVVRRNLGG